MPFIVSKTVKSAVASAMLSTESLDVDGQIESVLPIMQEFFQPRIEVVCDSRNVCANKTFVDRPTLKIIGYYITYRKDGDVFTVEKML